ncbi:MAG: hypothetical protein ABH832_04065 [bacterium]
MFSVKEIFIVGLKMGIKADPRGQDGIKNYLVRVKKEYDEMKLNEKKVF